jgi:hypothetical protein
MNDSGLRQERQRADSTHTRALLSEVSAMLTLDHPHIVKVCVCGGGGGRGGRA